MIDRDKIELASEYFNKALKIFIHSDERKGIAGVYNNLGSMYEYKGNYDSSLYYFNK